MHSRTVAALRRRSPAPALAALAALLIAAAPAAAEDWQYVTKVASTQGSPSVFIAGITGPTPEI